VQRGTDVPDGYKMNDPLGKKNAGFEIYFKSSVFFPFYQTHETIIRIFTENILNKKLR
jgi:hypothetical protein